MVRALWFCYTSDSSCNSRDRREGYFHGKRTASGEGFNRSKCDSWQGKPRLPDRTGSRAGKCDIIVALSTTAARPAKQATSTIPIVAMAMADPVADELVATLARPGGNVTGTNFLGPELAAKRLQLLREVIPGLSHVAALWHPNAYSERTMAGVSKEIEAAARTLGLQLQLVPAFGPTILSARSPR
jgi:hypothetical protein